MITAGCKTAHEPDGYRVVGYDGSTRQWTIVRAGSFEGKYLVKRLVVICSLYQWGDHDALLGPDVCHLQVGRLIIPNPQPDVAHRSQFLDVFEMPSEILAITEGYGADRVIQQFKILKYDVVTP